MKGRQFIVEMQVAEPNGFDKRAQYYTCRDYSMQINIGDDYPKLKPTYFIGILDFDYFDSNEYLSHIILNGSTYEHKLKDIEFTFIELKKFAKEIDELETPLEKWVFFIKNAENLDVIPENTHDEGLLEAYYDADRHNWKKEEYIAYDNAAIAEQDARAIMKLAVDRAVEKAVEETEQQTKKRTKEDMIARCWNKNMMFDDIAEIANLSVEEVKEIIDKLDK